MSEHKTSFESDVESLDINEDFVLVGLNNGSIACISLKVNICCEIRVNITKSNDSCFKYGMLFFIIVGKRNQMD